MDRGVKIAIFVASILSLGLGLIWDQVLSHARVMVEQTSTDELAPEVINARMGSPDIERLEVPEDIGPNFTIQPVDMAPVEGDAAEEGSTPVTESEWSDYVVQDGDSWWKLAHLRFKDRGLSSTDIEKANKGKVLRPGEVMRIPPNKEALGQGAPATTRRESTVSSSGSAETEYVVQDGDSWWKIAYVRFKDRELTSDDIANANPGVKLVAGRTVKIPAGR